MEAPRGVLDIVEKEKEAAALDGSRDVMTCHFGYNESIL